MEYILYTYRELFELMSIGIVSGIGVCSIISIFGLAIKGILNIYKLSVDK